MTHRANAAMRAAVAVIAGLAMATVMVAGEINFEGLPAGQVIHKVQNGAGATGLPKGFVGVFGFNPLFGTAINAAIVFDSACPPRGIPRDCTGGDADLGTPNQVFGGPGVGAGGESGPFQNTVPLFKVGIVAENLIDANGDGLIDDPDDADQRGEFIEFDFRGLKGSKPVTVNRLTYVDNDAGEFNAAVQFFGPGTLNPSTIALMPVGNNGVGTFQPGIGGVDRMTVILDGSGAVDNVVIEEPVARPCWVTTGGFRRASVAGPGGKKYCTFGGNVGPPPSGAFEVNWHETGNPALDGAKFHTNGINAIRCEDSGGTGPGQPGGKKGLEVDTLFFECAGRFNNQAGFSCSGYLRDGGEPAGKKGNDPDRIVFEVFDSGGVLVASCSGALDGGNVQIHPPVGNR